MKSLTPQRLAIGGCVLAGIIVALAGYLLAVQPQTSKAQSLDMQIAQAQQQYQALHETRSGRGDSQHAADLFQLSRAMPETDDQPGVLVELSRLSAASSVKLVSVTMQSRVALTDGSSALPIQVALDGNWVHLARFLRLLRNEVQVRGKAISISGRLFTIDQLSFVPSTDTPNDVQLQLRMNAFEYGAPPSPTATAGQTGNTTTTTTTTTSSSSGSQQAAGSSGSSS